MIASELLDDTRKLASFRYLDLVEADPIVSWASEKLVWFPDVEALAKIATEYQPVDSLLLSQLLDELLIELGDPPMNGQRAGWFTVKSLAERIVGGSIDPEVGAQKIWWDVAMKVPELEPRLRTFIGLASEWEDDATHQSIYERDIVLAADKLLKEVQDIDG